MTIASDGLPAAITRLIAMFEHAAKLLGEQALIGLALIEGHNAGLPWLTPQEAAVRAGVSDDTARRHLKALLAIDRVTCCDLGSSRRAYRIDIKTADSILNRMHLLAFDRG